MSFYVVRVVSAAQIQPHPSLVWLIMCVCALADVISSAGWTEQDGMFVAPATGDYSTLQFFAASHPHLSQRVCRAICQVPVPQHRAKAEELPA